MRERKDRSFMLIRVSLSIVILFALSTTVFALPEWADSYGTTTPYAKSRYYTGFGIAQRNRDDAKVLEAAKTQAKADLISRIQVQVRSTITSRESSSEDGPSTVATSISESIAVLDIENVHFDVEKNLRNIYVLARVNKEALIAGYGSELNAALAEIVGLQKSAQRYRAEEDNAAALRVYASLRSALHNAYRIVGLLETVTRDSIPSIQIFPVDIGEVRYSGQELYAMAGQVDEALETLRYGRSADIDTAMDLMIVQLEEQGIANGTFRVANLTFRDSDYSSAFGAYAADAIETALARGYRGAGAERIVRGSYWIEEDEIVLRLIVQSDDGSICAGSVLRFPALSVPPDIERKPRNFEQALIDQREIAAGAIVDGGISIEMWTNKGRNADRLVFVEGDTIQFYFRVNQPCYLQLTNIITTGEKLLLDESFYIGQDKVNRVVLYPVEFEPAPPFGVERVVVTAYEDPPPKPNVVIKTIEGYEYQVFESMEEVYYYAKTIRPKSEEDPDREIRVGETELTFTTVAKTEED